MFRRFSVNFSILSIVLDCIIISFSLYVAAEIRPLLSTLPFAREMQTPFLVPIPFYLIFSGGWVTILLLFSVYDGRRNLKIVDELTNLTLGSILASIALAGVLYLSFREVSRLQYLVFVSIAISLLVSWRLTIRLFYRIKTRSLESRRVLIIGAGPVGRELEKNIVRHTFLGLELVGFMDDDPLKRASNPDIFGPLIWTREIVTENNVDDVVIALPQLAYKEVNNLVAELHNLPVKVWVIPDYFHLALHRASVEEFAGIPMLDLRAPAINDIQRMVKRGFDLAISIICLPPAMILMGLISIAIKIEGPGPVIFQQERVGENGRIFQMYKFRTMVLNAEELRHTVERIDPSGNFIHKSVNDPRVTRVGQFLRRSSLDELPQIINILQGTMSLVGPRPEMPYMMNQYQPWQHSRFAVPQGLTGWWQVNGRSDKPMHLHTDEDLYYVQNYSLALDIEILIKTVWVVIRGNGAF